MMCFVCILRLIRKKRLGSVCLDCRHYVEFECEMEKEEEDDAEFVEAVRRDPDAYLRGDI